MIRPTQTRRAPRPTAIASAALYAALASFGASCAHKPPATRPYPAPTAEALLGAVSARQAAVRSMNARVRATSWLGGERLRATVLMLVDRGGSLRFEAEVSLQGTVAVLATDGQAFALLDLQKNELRRGSACPENVASLIRIPLAPAEVAAILLGDVALPRPPPPATSLQVDWDRTRGADVLALAGDGGRELHLYFRMNGALPELVGASAHAAGGRLWEVAFQDMERVGDVRLPALIRFAEGKGSFDDGVEIKFKDRTLNVSPPPADFTLSAPAGVTEVYVPCGGFAPPPGPER